MLGVIAYAVAIEEVAAHPEDPLSVAARVALALGLLLFIGGMAVVVCRATRRIFLARLILVIATVALIMLPIGLIAPYTLAIGLAGAVLIALVEELSLKPG